MRLVLIAFAFGPTELETFICPMGNAPTATEIRFDGDTCRYGVHAGATQNAGARRICHISTPQALTVTLTDDLPATVQNTANGRALHGTCTRE
ncbi:MAG: hypothetical protein AAGE76_06940 [Pseudomonadota bacterium]